MNDTRLTKDALYVPSIVFESGTLSSSSEGKVTWNGEELGGSTLDASGDITFTGLDTFTQYVTFNGGMICNSDIVLNGARLLLANGASVELYTGEDIPLPEGGGDSGSTSPGTGNSGESIDTSNFAKLNEDNTFTGNNNFTGNLTLDCDSVLTADDLSNYVTNDTLSNKNYLTSSALTDYAKKTDLNSYATTASLSSYLKSSDIKGYISSSNKSSNNWYIKYSDGLILQGGTLSITSNITTITFPTPFSSIPSIYLSRATTRGQGSWDSELYPYSISKSNFTYKMNTTEVSNATWFAIGY